VLVEPDDPGGVVLDVPAEQEEEQDSQIVLRRSDCCSIPIRGA
jgi:hypothetical protein